MSPHEPVICGTPTSRNVKFFCLKSAKIVVLILFRMFFFYDTLDSVLHYTFITMFWFNQTVQPTLESLHRLPCFPKDEHANTKS